MVHVGLCLLLPVLLWASVNICGRELLLIRRCCSVQYVDKIHAILLLLISTSTSIVRSMTTFSSTTFSAAVFAVAVGYKTVAFVCVVSVLAATAAVVAATAAAVALNADEIIVGKTHAVQLVVITVAMVTRLGHGEDDVLLATEYEQCYCGSESDEEEQSPYGCCHVRSSPRRRGGRCYPSSHRRVRRYLR